MATYRLPAATGTGYTLLGSPRDHRQPGRHRHLPEIAERLWDVDPTANTETLVARGLYRRRPTGGMQVFQLHPGAWHFAAGHIPKLELLGQDPPYARTSNGQFSIAVSDLQFPLPVHEVPGAPGTPPAVTPSRGRDAPPASRGPPRRSPASGVARRHRLILAGRAAERPCAPPAHQRRRRSVSLACYVMISRPAGHGRCRFLTAAGQLTRPRSCRRPIEFRAPRHRPLAAHACGLRVPPGRYLVRADRGRRPAPPAREHGTACACADGRAFTCAITASGPSAYRPWRDRSR